MKSLGQILVEYDQYCAKAKEALNEISAYIPGREGIVYVAGAHAFMRREGALEEIPCVTIGAGEQPALKAYTPTEDYAGVGVPPSAPSAAAIATHIWETVDEGSVSTPNPLPALDRKQWIVSSAGWGVLQEELKHLLSLGPRMNGQSVTFRQEGTGVEREYGIIFADPGPPPIIRLQPEMGIPVSSSVLRGSGLYEDAYDDAAKFACEIAQALAKGAI